MMVLGFALSLLGCVLLSLSMKRHYAQVTKDGRLSKRVSIVLRMLACLCLFACGVVCIQRYGVGIGLVWCWGLLTLAALLQTLLLAYRSQWLRALKEIVY